MPGEEAPSRDPSTRGDCENTSGGGQDGEQVWLRLDEVLDILRWADGEFTAVCHMPVGGQFGSSVVKSVDASALVASLPGKECVWFSGNPTAGPERHHRGRGNERAVTRWAGIPLDLDVKEGAFQDLGQAAEFIATMSGFLGTDPSVVIFSGHGLQPIWVIEDGELDTEESWKRAYRLIRRFGRFAAAIAWGDFKVALDTVWDLARVLRVPGTTNWKDQDKPVGVDAERGGGGPLRVDRIEEVLDEWAPEIDSDKPVSGETISPPEEWQFGQDTCNYVNTMVSAWAHESDKPTGGRHQWAMTRAVRLAAAFRLRCITEDDLKAALQALEAALAYWCQTVGAPRELAPDEVGSAFRWGMATVATFDDDRVRQELGNHKHGQDNGESGRADGGRYFNHAGLRAATLLRDCEQLGPLASGIDGKVWAYKDGVWVHGDRVLRSRVVSLLGERYRRAHADTVESMVQSREPFINDTPATEYLNVENGLLQWRTGRLLPHTPTVPSTTRIPIRWNPDAQCPNIDKFLQEVVDVDCVPVLEEVAGYAMYPSQPLHKAVMLDGNGRNGKGKYLLILATLLGAANIAAVPPQRLDSDKWAVAQLYGKLANLVGDVDPRTFKETATFKQATGEDLLQGEHKYCSPFMFTSRATIVAAFNSLPRSVDTTEGFFSRWLVVPFPNRFADPDENGNIPAGCYARDPDLDSKIITTAELEGFLVRGVNGLRRVMARGQFSHAKAIADAEKEFRRHADPVRGFLSEKVIADPAGWISRTGLHTAFKEWSADSGLGALSAMRFAEKVREVHSEIFGYTHVGATRIGVRGWSGIRLRLPADGG